MTVAERRNIIMDVLHKQGVIKITDIASMFDISPETARRDLDFLQGQQLIHRTHGGAIPIELDVIYELVDSDATVFVLGGIASREEHDITGDMMLVLSFPPVPLTSLISLFPAQTFPKNISLPFVTAELN